jgi:hypothetical protein
MLFSSNNLDDKILSSLNKFTKNDMDYIQFYNLSSNVNYNDIMNVWIQFLKNKYIEKEENKLDIKDDLIYSSFKIGIQEHKLSVLLENLFKYHYEMIYDDLLLFYIKDSNQILILFKSYEPLLDYEEIKLPYWDYIISIDNKSKFNFPILFSDLFKKNENLCIMGFSL